MANDLKQEFVVILDEYFLIEAYSIDNGSFLVLHILYVGDDRSGFRRKEMAVHLSYLSVLRLPVLVFHRCLILYYFIKHNKNTFLLDMCIVDVLISNSPSVKYLDKQNPHKNIIYFVASL